MIDERRLLDRLCTAAGMSCLLGALLLAAGGVQTVRADEDPDPNSHELPRLEAGPAVPPAAAMPVETAAPPRPGIVPENPVVPAEEIRPDVIVLNNRGYNYGPERPKGDAPSPR